jgi:hypothetical protein
MKRLNPIDWIVVVWKGALDYFRQGRPVRGETGTPKLPKK